jgi:PAS domain S-box-containing protein
MRPYSTLRDWIAPGGLREPVRVAVIVLAYFAAQVLAFRFPDASGLVAAVWPAAGIGLAGLLLSPRRHWPALLGCLFVAGLLANLTTDRPVIACVGFMIANVCETAASAWLIQRWCGDRVSFARRRAVLTLAFSASVVNAVTAVLGAGVATLALGTRFWAFYGMWWVSNGLGLLLVTPLILVWTVPWRSQADSRWEQVLETTALLVFGGGATWFIFGRETGDASFQTPPYLLMIPVSWGAIRCGPRGTATLLAILSLIAVICTAAGVGAFPLGGATPELRLLSVQVFLGVMGLAGMLLAASVTREREAQALLHQDIARRTQVEAALQENERKYRRIFENVQDVFYEVALDGTIQEISPSIAAVSGGQYTREDLLGRSMYEFYADAQRRETLLQVLRESGSVTDYEVLLKNRDGSVRPCSLSSVLRRDPDGNPSHVIGTLRDVSERRRAEEERGKLRLQLEQAQKLEAVGRLAGGVAHDFNNLLMGIMSYVELCRDGLPPEHPVRSYLNEISADAQRSANITQQLLAFARKQVIAPRILDVNEALAGMLKMLQHLMGEDIELTWQLSANLWPVRMDSSQLDQILANLCLNARDAIAGVGRVTIETANTRLDADPGAESTCAAPGDYVRLTVSDSGCGMSRDVLEHVFEPFFTTKGVGKGTGLGLATVHGIVIQNHGRIDVHSEVGQGTTFHIHLPRAAAPAPAALPAAASARPRGTETILLVEDEKSVRLTTQQFLERLGYTVLVAETPAAALRLADAHAGPLHLLITDVIMPGMNGRDLADRLSGQLSDLKCLFMSGYTADITVRRGTLDATVQFMAKPFSRDDLARKVRAVLDGDTGRPPVA